MNANRRSPEHEIERRAHPRRPVTAPVQIREIKTGREIEGRLADLSYGGCFVEAAETLQAGSEAEIVIANASEFVRARVRIATNHPDKGMGMEFLEMNAEPLHLVGAWLDKSLQNQWFAARRQRGQRLPLRVPVRAVGAGAPGNDFAEESYTSEVNPYGASITLSKDVKEGSRLLISHLKRRASAECLVVSSQPNKAGGFQIGVAFVQPAPEFWLVSFPPVPRPTSPTVAVPASVRSRMSSVLCLAQAGA